MRYCFSSLVRLALKGPPTIRGTEMMPPSIASVLEAHHHRHVPAHQHKQHRTLGNISLRARGVRPCLQARRDSAPAHQRRSHAAQVRGIPGQKHVDLEEARVFRGLGPARKTRHAQKPPVEGRGLLEDIRICPTRVTRQRSARDHCACLTEPTGARAPSLPSHRILLTRTDLTEYRVNR